MLLTGKTQRAARTGACRQPPATHGSGLPAPTLSRSVPQFPSSSHLPHLACFVRALRALLLASPKPWSQPTLRHMPARTSTGLVLTLTRVSTHKAVACRFRKPPSGAEEGATGRQHRHPASHRGLPTPLATGARAQLPSEDRAARTAAGQTPPRSHLPRRARRGRARSRTQPCHGLGQPLRPRRRASSAHACGDSHPRTGAPGRSKTPPPPLPAPGPRAPSCRVASTDRWAPQVPALPGRRSSATGLARADPAAPSCCTPAPASRRITLGCCTPAAPGSSAPGMARLHPAARGRRTRVTLRCGTPAPASRRVMLGCCTPAAPSSSATGLARPGGRGCGTPGCPCWGCGTPVLAGSPAARASPARGRPRPAPAAPLDRRRPLPEPAAAPRPGGRQGAAARPGAAGRTGAAWLLWRTGAGGDGKARWRHRRKGRRARPAGSCSAGGRAAPPTAI